MTGKQEQVWINPLTNQGVDIPERWQIIGNPEQDLVLEDGNGCACYVNVIRDQPSLPKWIEQLKENGFRPLGKWQYDLVEGMQIAKAPLARPKFGTQVEVIVAIHHGNVINIISYGWIGNDTVAAPPQSLIIALLQSLKPDS